jgi:hypothetical protein
MRQIAHEILSTINQHVPELSAHAQPVVPPSPLRGNASLLCSNLSMEIQEIQRMIGEH